MLSLLGMERSKTARECIQTMGKLAETYGYGFNDDGEMFAVSDPNEVWVFEIMPVGPLWTPETRQARRGLVRPAHPRRSMSRVCPNESRIGEIDLNNKDFFLASPNVISCAVENKLYDPASGKPFSWKRAYSPREGSASSTQGRMARMWRFYNIVAPSLKIGPETPDMDIPFSVKPDKPLSAADVMAITRDKCYGTPFDPVKGIRGGQYLNPNYYSGTRKISVNNVEYTSLVQCRSGLPNDIGGIIWLSFGPQDTAVYMPLYAGITAMPKSFMLGDHFELNRASARWAFDYTDFHVQVAYSEAIEDVKKAQIEYEDGRHPENPRDRQAGSGSLRQEPGQGPRAPDQVLPRQRPEGRDRLVGARATSSSSSTTTSASTTAKSGPAAAEKRPRRSGRKPSSCSTSWPTWKNNRLKESRP